MNKDVVFDIDGTLANADHRIHLILDPAHWKGVPPRPDWGGFLDNSMVEKDTPIPETWDILNGFIIQGYRVCFITGRPETQRDLTWQWLTSHVCPVRGKFAHAFETNTAGISKHRLYMRKTHDHRPSDIVKGELLDRARADGYNPTMAFEDRIQDTAMWRAKGLRCFQVAEGNY